MKTMIIYIWGWDFNLFQTGPLAFNICVPQLLVFLPCGVMFICFHVIKSLPFKFLSLLKRNIHSAIAGNSSVVMLNMLPSGHSVLWQLLMLLIKDALRYL